MRKVGNSLTLASAATMCYLAVSVLVVLSTTPSNAADGQAAVQESGHPTNWQGVKEYWTPERMRNAKPLEAYASNLDENGYPLSEPPISPPGSPLVLHAESGGSIKGAPPQVKPQNLSPLPLSESPDPSPLAFSPLFSYFTTTRVFPDAARTAYPNSTAGKLWGTDPRTGLDFECSASVLYYRVVLTAGHCVYDAVNQNYYVNFAFTPAYDGTAPIGFQAPFGTWVFDWVMATPAWINGQPNGRGVFPNFQDVAMLVAEDQVVGRTVRRIGELTDFLTALTNSTCIVLPFFPPGCSQHLTMLGYPGNLDDGLQMEANFASPLLLFAFGGANTFRFGSAMRAGSSGGPWIQDYGVEPVPTGPEGPPAGFLGGNYVVSVTSYIPRNFPQWWFAGSQFDNVQFVNLFNAACNQGVGNCTP